MSAYYYIIDKPYKTAWCYIDLKIAKKMAIEKNSQIYYNKQDLPNWVEKVEGFCKPTLRRSDGKFAKKFCKKFFNEDIKSVDK